MLLSGINTVSGAIIIPETKSQITSLKSTVLVNNSEITADSLIKNETNSKVREQLAKIQIGHIPDPLGELVINKAEMQRKLGSLAANLTIPDKITIRRDGAILKCSEVTERISKACHNKVEDELTIDYSRIPANIVLPGVLQNWEISTNSENTLGMRLFVLTAQTTGGPFRQLVQVKVSKVVEAAELVRLAKPGEIVSSQMIQKKKIEIKSDQSNVPVTYEEAVGKCLGRYKSPGTVLRSSDLSIGEKNICTGSSSKNSTVPEIFKQTSNRNNWLVKPGESVDFHFNSGALSLKIPAKAVQGGGEGDEITLINLQNQHRIRGVIKDKGRVEYAQN
ncbi:MAG: flagella basal body P-ring formation protein FlgA [Candidatus Riflebacteria bacterium]|nr:flagella basal body P-ring formation protein FlgA [Candidatus Riflebacteria bacterium]